MTEIHWEYLLEATPFEFDAIQQAIETVTTNKQPQEECITNDQLSTSTALASSSLNKDKASIIRLCRHQGGCANNALQGLVRGFWVGFAFRAGFATLNLLLFQRMFNKPLTVLQEALGWNTMKLALFFGVFTSAFKAIQCFLRRIRQTEDRWNAFIAGSLAASALLLDSPERQSTWSLWMLSRALDLTWRSLTNHGILPHIPYGEVLAFSFFAAPVMYAWHLEPQALPRAYHKWISARGGLDDRVTGGLKDVIEGRVPDMISWCKHNHIAEYHHSPTATMIPCSVVHPLQSSSCTLHAMKRWVLGFRSGLPVYATVHLLPLLIFRLAAIKKKPVQEMMKVGQAIFCSTSFITSFQTIFWITFCSVRNFLQRDSRLATLAASSLSGLSVLWEPPGRRVELALFTAPRAMESTWQVLCKYGVVKNVAHAHLYLFALSMGFIMMFYQHEPKVIKHTYFQYLYAFFGNN